jgi:hypothetical protein
MSLVPAIIIIQVTNSDTFAPKKLKLNNDLGDDLRSAAVTFAGEKGRVRSVKIHTDGARVIQAAFPPLDTGDS